MTAAALPDSLTLRTFIQSSKRLESRRWFITLRHTVLVWIDKHFKDCAQRRASSLSHLFIFH
jgi:hypothetical protein